MTRTFNVFEDQPQPLSLEDNAEVQRFKKEFDFSSIDSLEKSIQRFDEITHHYVTQYDAIIKTANEGGDLSYAIALNECLLRDLKLRAVAAFEVIAEVQLFSCELSDRLLYIGMYIAEEREIHKKNRASLSRRLSYSLGWQAAG